MTDDQRKKYEEAAKEYAANAIGDEESMIPETRIYYDACIEDFLAGCTFASQDTEERVKQAHNAALDKLAEVIRERQKELLSPERWAGVQVCIDEIQKLKL